MKDAWQSLENGEIKIARQQFIQLADAHPRDGRPRIGMALTKARAGNLNGAVGQLRNILSTAPQSMEQLMGRNQKSTKYYQHPSHSQRNSHLECLYLTS